MIRQREEAPPAAVAEPGPRPPQAEEAPPAANLAPPEPEVAPPAPAPEENVIPRFPWPPPAASAKMVLPAELLHRPNKRETLRDVARRLETAFDKAGYGELSYYAVPKGFAIVSRLEQIEPDGTPVKLPGRWSVKITPPEVFSLASYIKVLFSANPGYFRVVVFIITSEPVVENAETQVSREDALKWLRKGANKLPPEYAQIPFNDNYDCTALIYEFEQKTRDQDAQLILFGLPAQIHLEKANLLRGLAAMPVR